MSNLKIDKLSLILIFLSALVVLHAGQCIVNGIDVKYNLFMFGLNVFAMTVNFYGIIKE
jgi:Co/Zn/Cd efflux system component